MKKGYAFVAILLFAICIMNVPFTVAVTQHAAEMSLEEREGLLQIGGKIGSQIRELANKYDKELTAEEKIICLLLNDRLNALHTDDAWQKLQRDVEDVNSYAQFSKLLHSDYMGITVTSSELPQKSDMQTRLTQFMDLAGYGEALPIQAMIAYPYYRDDATLWFACCSNSNGESVFVDVSPSLELQAIWSDFMVDLKEVRPIGEDRDKVAEKALTFLSRQGYKLEPAEYTMDVDASVYRSQSGIEIAKVYIYHKDFKDFEFLTSGNYVPCSYVALDVENGRIYEFRNRI